jgi:hypothetical protein
MPPGARGAVTLRVQGGLALRDLSSELKGHANRQQLSRRMRANVRAAGAPVVADLRRAVLAVEVESDQGGFARPDRDRGLRQMVARALAISITQKGIRIRVNEKKVDPRYGRSLPRYLDASLQKYQRWRHPVFGHDVWVEQKGQPWFFVTILRHADDFRRAVLKALDDTIDELSK